MKVHRAAALEHYARHCDPVWQALPPGLRGLSWAPRECWWGAPRSRVDRQPADEPVMVAGLADARRFPGRSLIHVSHGAGQTYKGVTLGSYAGGDGLDDVVIFISPNERDAQAWRNRYPKAAAIAVGCPRLDRWHGKMGAGFQRAEVVGGGTPAPECGRIPPSEPSRGEVDSATRPTRRQQERGRDAHPQALAHGILGRSAGIPASGAGGDTPQSPRRPLVAISLHWQCELIPETTSALNHYRRSLAGLRDAVRAAGGELLGHGHPRAWGQLRRTWLALGIPHTPDQDVVFDQADVLIVDNSSCGPEAASVGIPVVWLSAPWYRRDVHHGGRFWDWVDGQPHVESPDQLAPTVLAVMADPTIGAEGRARMVADVYAYTDGRAAERAAEAVMGLAVGPPR